MQHFIHPFLSRLIVCNSSSVPIAFHQFLTWIALGDVDLRFSLMLLRKAVLLLKRKLNELHDDITDVISMHTLQGHEIFHFYRASRPNLWPIQPPVQLVLGHFPQG